MKFLIKLVAPQNWMRSSYIVDNNDFWLRNCVVSASIELNSSCSLSNFPFLPYHNTNLTVEDTSVFSHWQYGLSSFTSFIDDITPCRELEVLHLMDILLSKGHRMNSPTHTVVPIWIPDIIVRLGGTGH